MNPPFNRFMRAAWMAALAVVMFLAWRSLDQPPAGESATPSQPTTKQVLPRRLMAAQLSRAKAEDQRDALPELLAGRPLVLVNNGRPQHFRLSLTEVYLTEASVKERFRSIEPQRDAAELMATAQKIGGDSVGWVLYPVGREGEARARHVLHKRIHLQTRDRQATLATLARHGLRVLSEPDYSPGSLIVEPATGGPEATLKALAALSEDPATASVGPLLMRQALPHLVPNDPLFSQQWHLRNGGQGGGKSGVDMKVTTAWDSYRGQGVKIAIVDNGLDLLHPDLAANADSTNHYDWNDFPADEDPSPVAAFQDYHGTAVGGVAAARGSNGVGVSGVAPLATLVGFRLISAPTDDAQDADAMSRGKEVIDIKNCSWGTGALADETLAPGPLMLAAREDAVKTGRLGKGTLFIWSAGNGRNEYQQGQKDGAPNSIHVIPVGAVTNTGALALYSETGPHLITVAPSNGGTRSIYTTDLRGANGYNQLGTVTGEAADLNYTAKFGGTSSAAPAVAGVAALMLQANPNLNWRDVKEILLRSSVKIFPTDTGWVSRAGGLSSISPIKHHSSYGGGMTDAQAAVTMAKNWRSLGPMLEESRSSGVIRSIPDNSSTGINTLFDFSSIIPLRLEHVTVKLRIWHSYRGDLDIKLTSPSGTVSTLASMELADAGIDYDDWLFTSARHWGEPGSGLWTLSIKDLSGGDVGTLRSATLTLFGTRAPFISQHTAGPLLLEAGEPLYLDVTANNAGDLLHTWTLNGKVTATTGDRLEVSSVTAASAGTYTVKAANSAGEDSSDPIQVAVVSRTLPSLTLNQGTTLSLSVTATGPDLNYRWYRNDTELADGGRFSGTGQRTLTITHLEEFDTGAYTCVVGMAGSARTLQTLPATVTVRLKPIVVVPALGTGVISGIVQGSFTATHGATRFTLTGLPPGVLFNTTTGVLSGRPTRAGNYLLNVTATNLAGTSEAVKVPWIVEDFPLSARGTWSGLVDRHSLNSDLGGRLTLTVASTGSYSGTITLGSRVHSWSSRVDALPGQASPTTSFSISRGTTLPALRVEFTLHLGTGTLTGSVSDGLQTATFRAMRQTWSATVKPVLATTLYNTALELPSELITDARHPQGHGHAALTLTTSGGVTWAGRLADGTSLTAGTTLGPGGEASLHLMLYANTGSAQGWSTLNLVNHLVDGAVSWMKLKQADTSTTRSYKAGIPQHRLTLRGARYVRPLSGQMILNLDPQPATGPLIHNARLRFTRPPLISPLEQWLAITKLNTASVPTALTQNPQSVRLTFTATTGTFSGTFAFTDNDPFDLIPPIAKITRSASFSGLLVTRPDLNQGSGYFNLAELPDVATEKSTTTPIVSGLAEFLPSSAP